MGNVISSLRLYLEVMYAFLACRDLHVSYFKATFWLNGDLKEIPICKHVLKNISNQMVYVLHIVDIVF